MCPFPGSRSPSPNPWEVDPVSASAPDVDRKEGEDGCDLCGLPVDPEPVEADDVVGTYCCQGCLSIARAVDGAETAPLETQARDGGPEPPDAETTYRSVEGMHCSTCERFLEAALLEVEGVYDASASYASEMLKITHEEGAEIDALAERLERYGYRIVDPETGAGRGSDSSTARVLIGLLFGMMAMVWYALFVYPTYLGLDPVVALTGVERLYLRGNLWLVSSIVLFYTGFPLLRGALVSLLSLRPNMDLLVSVAAVGAYAYSSLAVVLGGSHVYFDVSIVVVLAVTVGGLYQDRVKRRAASGLSELTKARVDAALCVRPEGEPETVPVDRLEPGDRVLVKPGQRVPVDGEVAEGIAAVDESLVTGEARPVTRREGDRVLGGTVVTDDPLVVTVGEGAESTVNRLVELLWDVQSSRSGTQRLADRIAAVFVPGVLVLAVLATAWHVLAGTPPGSALLAGLAVLIVSCPCALGLATPLAVASGVREATKRGIVVASEGLFEQAPAVDVVALDKTGTLTEGRMAVAGVEPDGSDPDEVLAVAAALERYASHPVAEAITQQAGDGRSLAVDADHVRVLSRGVVGRLDGREAIVGHPDLLASRGVPVPEDLERETHEARKQGQVPVLVGWGDRVLGLVSVADRPREGWSAAVERLGADREVVVLTGDDERATGPFEADPRVDEVFAGVPPEAKNEAIQRLQARGTVAMVGDGSNDAPALATADVGIALASGTDMAAEAADAVVVQGGLENAPAVLGLAEATNRRIRQNLGWAFLYNAVAIPVAALGLLNPLVASLAMASSSLAVVANSARSM